MISASDLTMEGADVAWCPGCGNFGILNIMKSVLSELKIENRDLVMVSGIGQAAKMPQYINANMFNGLHGRALPAATAIAASNPRLTVIAESGEGDMYGEGGNHFIHTIRRNPNITNIVHNNMVYGLTKGQASPTSQRGMKTPVQVAGVYLEPFNPLAVALALDATFVARAFCGDVEKTKDIIKAAIMHRGYALVDLFQPCVTFNKINTYQWYKQNCEYLPDGYDPSNKMAAFEKALSNDRISLGILYQRQGKKTLEDELGVGDIPRFEKARDKGQLSTLIDSFR